MAARASVRAERETDAPLTGAATVRAVRAVWDDVALRAALDCTVVFAVRAPRDVVARDGVVAVRDVTVPVRAVAADVRAVDVDVVADWRLMLDVSRTAALATPMPTAIVPTKSKNFFIFMLSMISKSGRGGNEYLHYCE